MDYQEILKNFKVEKTAENKTMAYCPCHDDQKASLEITHENGKTLMHCFAGCKTEDILKNVDLSMSDLFEEELKKKESSDQTERNKKMVDFELYVSDPNNEVEATYDYTNPNNGEYVKSKIRKKEKKFLAGVKEGKDLHFGTDSVKDTPAIYGDLDRIKNSGEIFYVEGEKDVDTLSREGVVAFTCGGTTSLNPQTKEAIGKMVTGKDVIIFCDNDLSGKKHGIEVYDSLIETANSIKILTPTPHHKKGDISDFFERKNAYRDFQDLIRKENQYGSIFEEIINASAEEDDWKSKLEYDVSSSGDKKIRKITYNVVVILENDERFKDKLYFDEFTHSEVFNGDLPWRSESYGLWSDFDSICLKELIEKDYRIANKEIIESATKIVMRKHGFNPMGDLLNGLEYVGDGYVREIAEDYLGVEDVDYAEAALKVTMTGAIHRIKQPGCKFDTVLMLSGPQGVGKSTFFRILALKQEYFNDSLSSMDSKDAAMALSNAWIVELAELATFARTFSGVDGIKQFLTTQVDKIRVPYGKYVEELPRHCIFVGSTNRLEFLADSTGNRRFIVLDMHKHLFKKSITKDSHQLEDLVKKAWAEVLHEYNANLENIGNKLILPEKYEKIAEEMRIQTEMQDPMLPSVEKYLDGKEMTCVREVWDNVFIRHLDDGTPINYKFPDRKDSLRVSSILHKLGYVVGTTRNFAIFGKNKAFIKEKIEIHKEEVQSKLF